MRKSEVFVDPQDLSFYKIIFNEAPIGILFAQEHKIVYINPYFLKIFGYTKDDELIGKDTIIMYPPEIRQIQLQRAENRAERIEDSRSYEVDGIRKDGTRFPMNMTVSEVLIEGQSSLIAFISDLSEIKEVEKERNVTIAQYQTIFEKTPLGLVISRQGNILFCNKNFAQMFGYGVDDLVGSSVEIILDEQERSTIIERGIRREAGEEEPPSYNTIGLRKNGETFDIHIEVTPINLPEGVALLVFVQDVTTQKIAEVALIESEEHNRIMVENAPEAIIVMDVNTGLFIDANKNAEKLFNLPKSELITYGPLDLSPKYQPNGQVSSVYAETKIKEALTGLSTPFDWIYLDSAGQRIECEIRLASLPSTRNTLIIGSIIDISERKQSEIELQLTREQLFQAQKMETIGRITGGIAHDFNNMLTGIIGYTDILLSQVTETAYKEQIQDIKQIATKAATLTGELLSFSRKRVFKQQIVNLNTIIQNQSKILNTVTGDTVEIQTHFDPDLKNIKGDHTYLEQVIMNIVINAKDAMEPQGGLLKIETSNATKDQILNPDEFEKNTDFASLRITDEGIGMDEMVKEHIFEPFFSTKGVGKGTGLGLATVHGIVKQSGGYIDVITEIGKGSTFIIYFPAVELSITEVIKPSELVMDQEKVFDETILLVDDDKIVLDVVERILTERGFTVISTDKPQEAIKLANEHKDKVSMILTDVVMPKISGQAMVRNILKDKPGLKVLFMSGNTSDLNLYDDIQKHGYFIIEKPFTSATLIAKINQVISE